MSVPLESELLTPAELAARLKVSRRAIWRILATQLIPARLVGLRKRYYWPEVVSALPRCGTTPTMRGLTGVQRGDDLVTYAAQRAAVLRRLK